MKRAVVYSLLSLVATTAHADDARHARALYVEGMHHYNVGEYRKALESFKAGYYARADPAFLFNMGQAYRMLGDSENAIRQYRAFLREQPASPIRDEVVRLVAAEQTALRQRKAAEAAPANPAAAPSPAPPPPPAPTPTATRLVVEPAETPQPARVPLHRRWWLWTAIAGTLAAGTAVGAAVALTTPRDAPVPSSDFGAANLRF